MPLIDAMFPPGTRIRNTGTVRFDNPDRDLAYSRQYSLGYERQLGSTIGLSVDFIRSEQRKQYVLVDLNPATRSNGLATGTITRNTPLVGAPGEFAARVDTLENIGYIDYNTIQVSGTKRVSNGWSARLSYAFSRGRGNTATGQADTANSQVLGDFNQDLEYGPTAVDRPHILTVSASYDVPRTGGLKLSAVYSARSGTPFTLVDTTFDADRNGITANEYLPAGSYSGTGGEDAYDVDYEGGRNGARGPNYQRLDLRAGYRIRLGGGRTIDAFLDIFNADRRAELRQPDQRDNRRCWRIGGWLRRSCSSPRWSMEARRGRRRSICGSGSKRTRRFAAREPSLRRPATRTGRAAGRGFDSHEQGAADGRRPDEGRSPESHDERSDDGPTRARSAESFTRCATTRRAAPPPAPPRSPGAPESRRRPAPPPATRPRRPRTSADRAG